MDTAARDPVVTGGLDAAPVSWDAQPEGRQPGRASGFRWVLGVILAVVVAVVGLSFVGRLSDPVWSGTPTLRVAGDTWDGNLVSDGQRTVLLSREAIDGFWGVMTVRISQDSGTTWSDPISISPRLPNAARHALVLGSDGALWAAWAEQGPQAASQRLILRRSPDGGVTWTEPIRLSPPNVGLVGIPALVVSDRVRVVAFTNGTTGDVIVQRLAQDGSIEGDPSVVGRTTRELYSNAQFYDGGLAVGAVDDHVVLVYDDGNAARAIVSGDGGQTWTESWQEAGSTAPPRLVTQGHRFVAVRAARVGAGGQVEAVASDDGGATWKQVGRWTGRRALTLSLSAGPESTLAAWASCRNRSCSVADVRIGDIAAGLSNPTRIELGELGRPVGLAIAGSTAIVAWVREDPDDEAADRTLMIATSPKP